MTTAPTAFASEALGPAAEAAQGLYERHAGQVFAHCLARLGSRREAEAAVEKTFAKAARACARGEFAQAELPWLLRSAGRICDSRRRLAWVRARADGPLVASPQETLPPTGIVRDWQGLTFDQITAEFETRQGRLAQARKDLAASLGPWRRTLAVLDVGPALAWVKGMLGGAAAVKVAAAAAVAVTATTVVVTTPAVDSAQGKAIPARPVPLEAPPQTEAAEAAQPQRPLERARPLDAAPGSVHGARARGGEISAATPTARSASTTGSTVSHGPLAPQSSPTPTVPVEPQSPAGRGALPAPAPNDPQPGRAAPPKSGPPAAPQTPAVPQVPDLPVAPPVPPVPIAAPELPPVELPQVPPVPPVEVPKLPQPSITLPG